MYNSWYEVFPEISKIEDAKLRDQVVATCQKALEIGGWKLDDVDVIPFTLIIPDTIFSYHTHVRAVTRMALKAYEEWSVYGEKFKLNKDYLVAGAILHDVGKLIEYEKKEDGSMVKSRLGKCLRHPFSGTGVAMEMGIPYEVCHIIANHAHEGDGTLRSPEAVIIYYCDNLNFVGLKSFAGMI